MDGDRPIRRMTLVARVQFRTDGAADAQRLGAPGAFGRPRTDDAQAVARRALALERDQRRARSPRRSTRGSTVSPRSRGGVERLVVRAWPSA